MYIQPTVLVGSFMSTTVYANANFLLNSASCLAKSILFICNVMSSAGLSDEGGGGEGIKRVGGKEGGGG